MLNNGKPVVRSWWTMSVHHTWCGQPSRRLSRPVVWSIWLSSSTMALMPVSRRARAGCIGAKAWSLGADVGRGIAQHPVYAVVGQGDGRLSARSGPQGAVTKALAVDAVAVPLREPATGGGAENLDVHGHSLCKNRIGKTKTPRQAEAWNPKPGLAVSEVHGDFEADTQISVCRFGPHGITPSGWVWGCSVTTWVPPRTGGSRNWDCAILQEKFVLEG